MKYKEPCGCIHDGARWLSECAAHKAENDALHDQAMQDHKRSAPPTPHGPKRSASPTPEKDWLE